MSRFRVPATALRAALRACWMRWPGLAILALSARCGASCGPALPPVRAACRSRIADPWVGGRAAVDPDQGLQSVLPLDGCKAGEVSMEFAHWLMIGGALLVFVGLVGTALQRRRAAADPLEGEVADEQPAVPMPKSPE